MQLISTERDHNPFLSYHLHSLRYCFSSPYANLSFLAKSFFTHLAASGESLLLQTIARPELAIPIRLICCQERESSSK